MNLTDEQWIIQEPLLPQEECKPTHNRGRPWKGAREVLHGILWILRTGTPWHDLPERYPPYQTYMLMIIILLFLMGCNRNISNKAAATEFVPSVSTTSLSFSPISDAVDLYCKNHVTTRWGNNAAEWGFPDGFSGSIRTRLLPLRFDSENRLYFFDFANERLLVYEDSDIPKSISLKPLLFWDQLPFLFAIVIHEDKIFVPYYSNYLGILSTSGEVLGNVELPFSYDMFLPANSVIEVDPLGRLCTFRGTYDKGWENGIWQEVAGAGGCMDTYFWRYYSVTGNKSVSVTSEVLEIKDLARNSIFLVDTGLPKGRHLMSSLFGIDNSGNVYFDLTLTPPNWLYAKYSLLTHQVEIGQMLLDTDYNVVVPSVSPDGILYILAYSDKDLSVQPRIIRCRFPDE